MTIQPEKGMKKLNNSFLEIARQNHTNIIKKNELMKITLFTSKKIDTII